MYVEFQNMPDASRIWIYLSSKEFTQEQVVALETKLAAFCSRWTKHGEELKSSFQIKYNRFIILAVDEAFHDISGCAINKSIKLIQDIESEYELELMNRLNTAFKSDDAISVVDLQTFKSYAGNQNIDSNTLVYNNLVTTKAAFEKEWEIPAGKSWHARFLN
jgi:chemotaxis regulatin CheY-phosphate phosphatase CheZ